MKAATSPLRIIDPNRLLLPLFLHNIIDVFLRENERSAFIILSSWVMELAIASLSSNIKSVWMNRRGTSKDLVCRNAYAVLKVLPGDYCTFLPDTELMEQ